MQISAVLPPYPPLLPPAALRICHQHLLNPERAYMLEAEPFILVDSERAYNTKRGALSSTPPSPVQEM